MVIIVYPYEGSMHIGAVVDAESHWPIVLLIIVPMEVNFDSLDVLPWVVDNLKVRHNCIKVHLIKVGTFSMGCGSM